MRNGLYAAARLSGGVVSPNEFEDLFAGFGSVDANLTGWRDEARDPDVGAFDRHHDGGRATLLVGRVGAAQELRRELGLPPSAGSAAIAATAHDRWGVRAAEKLGGAWTLARWDEDDRALTLMASQCARDRLHYAADGDRVAVSPCVRRLAGLNWVDGAIDGDGLVASLGGYQVRRHLAGRTLVKGVSQVMPGSCVTIRARGVTVESAGPTEPVPSRSTPFEEAMHEVDALLLRIVREEIAGRRDVALLLSGGLDSSLLAALAAECLETGQRLHLLCSAVPAGTGIGDETGWAGLVAERLGTPLIAVTPQAAANAYLPSPRWLAAQDTPAPSPRHYLYEAMEDAAAARGAGLIVDGMFGELSVSAYGADWQASSWSARVTRSVRNWVSSRTSATRVGADAPHVRLSRSAWELFGDVAADQSAANSKPLESGPLAIGWEKAWSAPSATSHPDIRSAHPYRDPRLQRLAGSLPAEFATHDGAPRAMIRSLLQRRVPAAVANRHCKMPFSPGHSSLLRDHAEAARHAISEQRSAGVDEWLDLDWLDRSLTQAAKGSALGESEPLVQGTALAAEFLRRWKADAWEA